MIEKKSGQIIVCGKDAAELYVDVFDLGNKYYTMPWQELKQWLEDAQGVSFKTETRNIKVKVISDN